MAIVVVGGGAIGLLVAGRIAQARLPVALVTRAAGAAAIMTHGLAMTQDDATVHVANLVAASDPATLPPSYQHPDLTILCVKGYDTAGALPTLDALHPTTVLTLQNGIGNEEALAAHLDATRVISGAITSSVAVHTTDDAVQPHITVTKSGGIGLAPVGGTEDVVSTWATVFRAAGFDVRQYTDYRSLKWSKALLNMLGNATAAILDMPVDAVYADKRLVALEQRAFLEALAVMDRLGMRPINLPRYPAALLARAMRYLPAPLLYPLLRRTVAGGRGGKAPSLLGDLQRGRNRSEGAYLYGAVAHAADAAGVHAPVNHALWRVLDSIARGEQPWSAFRQQPQVLLNEVVQ